MAHLRHQSSHSTRPGAALGALAMGALVTLLAVAPGQTQTQQSPEEVRRQIEEVRRQLDETKRRQAGVQATVSDLAKEREQINARLIETAQSIQRSESQLTTIETRIGELEVLEKNLRGSLSLQHDQIARLLASVQKMGRNPPPVMITQREDALKMVRSAMLLAAAVPKMGEQAKALAERLGELVRVMDQARLEGEKLRAETQLHTAARARLSGLMEARKNTIGEQQAELEKLRREAAQIASRAESLDQMFAQIERAVELNTALGAYEAQRKAAEGQAVALAPVPKVDETPKLKPQIAPELPPPGAEAGGGAPKPAVVAAVPAPAFEIAPKGQPASFSPGRMQPAVAFSKAQKQLPFPVAGKRLLGFGERSQSGPAKGIWVETRHGARVISPCDGWVVYAGVFRNYGPLLIISGGEGYHVVLMGMSQIDVQLGQFLVAGEPVGLMPSAPRVEDKKLAATTPAITPSLYIEFRKDGRVINPDPWWTNPLLKVQG